MARRGRRARRGDSLGQGQRVLRRRQPAGNLGRLRYDRGDARAAPLQDRVRSFLPPQPRPARLGNLRQTGRRRDRGFGAGRRRRTRARLALPRANRRQTRGDRSSRVPGGAASGRRRTQRLPRLVGVEAAMPILLDGARLSGEAAIKAGLAHAVVKPGEDIAAAEDWLLSAPRRRSPGTATIGFLQRQPMSAPNSRR